MSYEMNVPLRLPPVYLGVTTKFKKGHSVIIYSELVLPLL